VRSSQRACRGAHGQNSLEQLRTPHLHSARTLCQRFDRRRPALGHRLGANGRWCGHSRGLHGEISALSDAISSPTQIQLVSVEKDVTKLRMQQTNLESFWGCVQTLCVVEYLVDTMAHTYVCTPFYSRRGRSPRQYT
jgi:hypothetical protein